MSFSQRYGYRSVRETIQLESMDQRLRISLWNALEIHYWSTFNNNFSSGRRSTSYNSCISIWKDFFGNPIDDIPGNWSRAKQYIRDFFFQRAQWFEVYDFVEFIPRADLHSYAGVRPTAFRIEVNEVLEREKAGYRFVDELIAPITDQTEIQEIESAISTENRPVSEHLQTSLQFLTDRDDHDYRNSVKESISAVEALVKATLGAEQGTLGNLIKRIDERATLHPAFSEALSKLYGYTSDEGGIRHSLTQESREVTFEEAKFMLVVCSAFVNYVRGNTGR